MQTPVRFYITEGDDRPVVRTIPVAVRPTEQIAPSISPAVGDRGDQPRVRVARLVRSAVKRYPSKQTP